MKVVCAWCQKVIVQDASADAFVSHGICDACAAKLLAPDRVSLEEFLNRFDFPVMAMSDDVVALGANHAAERLMGKPFSSMKGLRGGTILECAYARSPGGCGHDEHCSGCTLRRTITTTATDGQPRYGVTSVHLLQSGQGLQKVGIQFSTRMVGRTVIVTFDGLHRLNGGGGIQQPQ